MSHYSEYCDKIKVESVIINADYRYTRNLKENNCSRTSLVQTR